MPNIEQIHEAHPHCLICEGRMKYQATDNIWWCDCETDARFRKEHEPAKGAHVVTGKSIQLRPH